MEVEHLLFVEENGPARGHFHFHVSSRECTIVYEV